MSVKGQSDFKVDTVFTTAVSGLDTWVSDSEALWCYGRIILKIEREAINKIFVCFVFFFIKQVRKSEFITIRSVTSTDYQCLKAWCQQLILNTAPSMKAGGSCSQYPCRGGLVLPYACMEGDMWQFQAQLALPDMTGGSHLLSRTCFSSLWPHVLKHHIPGLVSGQTACGVVIQNWD